MGLKDFKIHFNSPYATYCPGQTVSGKVVLTLDAPKNVKGIKIIIKGEADTYWSTDRQELNNEGRYINETDVVTAHEEYFKSQFYILGSSSGDQIELPSGTNTYPFNFVLPPSLPSSFESDFGRIRYTAKAVLDRPWKFDQETKVAFTIVSHFDLNKEAKASEPVHLEKSKTFCCLCCGSPPLTVDITLPVRGYVPGQSIPVKVNVENQSGIQVNTIKIKLEKVVTYSATTPRSDKKIVETIIAEVSKGPVGGAANTIVNYTEFIDIPPTPPSNLQNCGIIDLEYKLKIEACMEGFYHRNLRDSTPIYIGTIPLSSNTMAQAPIRKMGDDTDDKDAMTPSAPPAELSPQQGIYPNLAPPSYEESVSGTRPLRDGNESQHIIGGEDRFAPRYPVYNFNHSP